MLSVLYKTVFMFVLVIIAMRVMGKRQLGQLEPSELVATIIMSELASMPIANDEIPLLHAAAAIGAILLIEIAISTIALKSIKLRQVFGGKPSAIIDNGRISKRELRRNRVTIDEFIEEMRQKDITDISSVKYAIMERSGMLSIVQQSATLPLIIISDGRLMRDNMNYLGVTEKYIMDELKSRGIDRVKDVFLLMLDEQHTFFLYTQLDVS